MNPLSYLNNADIGAFEGLYQQYLQDPQSVDPEWRNFFEGFEFSKTDYTQSATKKKPQKIKRKISHRNNSKKNSRSVT